ncbi:hypothetical protein J2Z76_000648 [Sedimentibacter acidaminivorans]|uniref:Uncharacterized protein n=1 Tax=Sedimentibacter acidaminivorans TaxID=913099 RepID=A0ABS4GBL8_9FIRM|nr:hypothetical protein [Sedimentibacter acidaminivorans]
MLPVSESKPEVGKVTSLVLFELMVTVSPSLATPAALFSCFPVMLPVLVLITVVAVELDPLVVVVAVMIAPTLALSTAIPVVVPAEATGVTSKLIYFSRSTA